MNIEHNNIEQVSQVSKLEALSKQDAPLETKSLNEAVDSFGMETRDFGLDECKESAKEIFTPEVMENWANLSPETRAHLAQEYADCVARNFQLVEYSGLSIEPMEGKNGFNRGDGVIHLSDHLINTQASPIQIVDTITHEMRHQYQMESLHGYHNVPDEKRLEWLQGLVTYNNDAPWAEDPIGYKYNPLETDARHAGETVAQSLAKDYLTEYFS